MTVEELIEKLKVEDPQAEVSIEGFYEPGGMLFVGTKEIFTNI